MATKDTGKTIEENFSTVVQAEFMKTQREFNDGWNSVEVLGVGPKHDEDEDDDEEEDQEKDEDDDGSDIEELDEDELDEDDSDEEDDDDED